MSFNVEILRRSFDVVQSRFKGASPVCGLILGSGLSDVISGVFNVRGSLGYDELPGLGAATVEGHYGKLLWADCAGVEVFVFQGRRHWYEDVGWEPIALPVYLLKMSHARFLFITNAAGGIRDDLLQGDIMLIDDHINAMGVNPLIGVNDPFWGERFPDQSAVYDPELRGLMYAAAEKTGRNQPHGIYIAVSGPTTETPAEVRAFRAMGADAIGMSTVPEAVLANAAGLRVFGASCIVNKAAGLSSAVFSHDNVMRAANEAADGMKWVLRTFFEELAGIV